MDDSFGRGTGIGSSLAAVPRAMRSPEEQPRLPYSSGSRDLFPLMRDPHRALPLKGHAQRVETLRRRLVDDALSALNWLSGKREPASFARNQVQDACVARVDTLACSMLGDLFTVGVPTSAEALSNVSRGLDACDSGAGSSTLAALSLPKLSLCHGSLLFALCVARLSRALPQGARAHGGRRDALCSGDVYRFRAVF